MLSNIFGSKMSSFAGLVGIVLPLVTWGGGLLGLTPEAITAVVSILSMLLGGTLFIVKDPSA